LGEVVSPDRAFGDASCPAPEDGSAAFDMSSRTTSAAHPIASRLATLMELSSHEVATLSALPMQVATLEAGQMVLRAGDQSSDWFLVLEGLVSTSRDLEDGKRQILSFHLPGDMPILLSYPGRAIDADLTALTACKLVSIEADALLDVCRRLPRIGELLWECALAMVAIQREWIVNVGHRSATSRVAHLMCEILTRLENLGLARNKTCDLPLTQLHLSQATGLSRIHVNRSCQELRKKGLLSFEHGRLIIHDWAALTRLAQFDPRYLSRPSPRWIGAPEKLEMDG
jgi:CRP-like cAMP-binding protein